MDFGKAIKQIRKEKKINQKQLAELSGMSVNGLCQIELGKVIPQKETFKKIAKALNVPDSYFFFLSVTEEDVAESRREVFNVLKDSISKLLLETYEQ